MNNNGWKKDYIRYKDFFLNVLTVYKTKPNLKIYLELILSLATVSIFAVFAIKPTVLTIIELNKEIKNKEVTISKLKTKIKNLQVASNLIQKESDNLQFVDLAVPKVASPENLILQLENLSLINSLNIINLTLSDVVLVGDTINTKKEKNIQPLADNASELPFSFSATGSYQNIINYLKSLENLRRAVKVDSLSINANVTDTGKMIILNITGRVPFYKTANDK